MAYRYSTGNPTLDMLRNGVRQTESSGNYRALGPVTKNGDRAYGAFQVMGSNIPNWTLKALGYPMTKEQFLADDKAQEAVFNHQFGGYLQKYGNPQDAVSAWFTGRPVAQAGNASDGYNNNGQYINKVFKNAGMPAVGQDPRSFQATGSDDMAGPAPAQPDASGTMDLPNNEQTNWGGIGSSLTNLGSIVAGLDKSIGGQLMARNLSNVASNQLREQALNQKDNKWSFAGFTPNKTGALFSNGNQTVVRPLGAYGGDEQKLQYRGIDSDEKGNRFDTFTDANGNLIRKPTEMVDPNVKQKTPMDPDALDLMTDGFLKGDPQVMTRLSADDKKEILGHAARRLKEAGVQNPSYDEIMANKAKFAGILADERKRSTAEADFDRSSSKFYADAKTALENSDKVERLGAKAWNMVGQFTTDQLQKQGAPELAAFRESTEALSRAYASALTQSGVTNQVAEEKARELLSTIQSKETYESVVKTMTSTVQRAGQSMRALHENQQDRNAGRTPRHKEYSEEKSMDDLLGLTGKKSSQPTGGSSPSQAHIDGLRAHPEMRDQFDAKFGPGAAAKILGN